MTSEENPLELALRAATTDVAARPDFYRLLLRSEVYFFAATGPQSGMDTFAEGERITVTSLTREDGTCVIPFYASFRALEKAVEEPMGQYVKMQAAAFFASTKGQSLVLNPKLDCSKEFAPKDTATLLDGGIPTVWERRAAEKSTTVLPAQPTERSSRILAALTSWVDAARQFRDGFRIGLARTGPTLRAQCATPEENPLELALRAATTDFAAWPDFYRLLLRSEVYLFATMMRPPGRHIVLEGERIKMQRLTRADGMHVIPFYSSFRALQQVVAKPKGYLSMPAAALFETTKGDSLLLNPELDCSKQFAPEHIAELLAGGIPSS